MGTKPTRMFLPFTSDRLSLTNRIVMSPMSRFRSPGGTPTRANAEYYVRRAVSGVGLVIGEGAFIDHPAAAGFQNAPNFFGNDALAGWKSILEGVHAAGAKMMPQLWHVGGARRASSGSGIDGPGYGPSDVIEQGNAVVVAATRRDLEDIIASYGRAAGDARRLGFDGVAIHGAHGYLLDQFLWRRANFRTDAFGRDVDGRSRLASDVVAAVRRAVGPDFPIVFRFSQWKSTDYDARIAETPAELNRILGHLVDAGVDVFDVSTRRFYLPAFEQDGRSLAAWTRHLSGKPVIAVGSVGLDQPHQTMMFRTADNVAAGVTDLGGVEEALERGDFDLVGVGRALLADARWVEKVRRGAFDEIAAFERSTMDAYD